MLNDTVSNLRVEKVLLDEAHQKELHHIKSFERSLGMAGYNLGDLVYQYNKLMERITECIDGYERNEAYDSEYINDLTEDIINFMENDISYLSGLLEDVDKNGLVTTFTDDRGNLDFKKNAIFTAYLKSLTTVSHYSDNITVITLQKFMDTIIKDMNEISDRLKNGNCGDIAAEIVSKYTIVCQNILDLGRRFSELTG